MPYIKISMFKLDKGDWIDLLIGYLTKSEHSHCEIIFPDEVSFGASPLKTKGFVHKRIPPIKYLDKCDIFYIEISEEDLLRTRKWCESKCYAKHRLEDDYVGFIEYLFHIVFQENRWHCSGFVTDALKVACNVTRFKSFTITPNKLKKVINEFNKKNIKKFGK